jgi:hypothetical protein
MPGSAPVVWRCWGRMRGRSDASQATWSGGSRHGARLAGHGVDGAVLVLPFAMHRYNAGYVLSVHAPHPGRFALIKPIDPGNSAVAETVADWAAIKGTDGNVRWHGAAGPE